MVAEPVKFKKLYDKFTSPKKNFVRKERINVNDLLKKRKEEKEIDKKINLFIVAGISAVAVVILVVFSF